MHLWCHVPIVMVFIETLLRTKVDSAEHAVRTLRHGRQYLGNKMTRCCIDCGFTIFAIEATYFRIAFSTSEPLLNVKIPDPKMA